MKNCVCITQQQLTINIFQYMALATTMSITKLNSLFQILLEKTNIREIKYQIYKEMLYKFNLKLREVKSAFHCVK